MAVSLLLNFSKLGLDDYDATCRALNFPAEWPDGLLAHGAADVDGRLQVIDVWESRDQFDRFVQERLQGALGKSLGDRAEAPAITETQLHSFHAL